MYYYGMRGQMPDIGRMNGIDRMAEKFESLSPYQYAGNNPVYFIDRNGEYIDINDPNGTDRYRYANGQTQKRQEDGSYKTIDASENLSDFVLNAIAGLNGLENSGKTGKGLINAFSGDSKSVQFSYRAVGGKFGNDAVRGENGGEDTIHLDTFLQNAWTTNGYQSDPLFVTIGHEMSHLTDPVIYHDPWFNQGVSNGEIRATHVENMIRAEAGLPLRTSYGERLKDCSAIPKGTIIDSQGNSVYYNSSGGRYVQPKTPQAGQMPASINDAVKASNGVILYSRYNYNDCH